LGRQNGRLLGYIAHPSLKRNLLLKEICKCGAVFIRHGVKHDIDKNSKTGTIEQISQYPLILRIRQIFKRNEAVLLGRLYKGKHATRAFGPVYALAG